MTSDERALRIAQEFVKYKNTVDEIQYGVESVRPRYELETTVEGKHIGRGIVYTAVPRVPIPRDDPSSANHMERRMSVVVCTAMYGHSGERASFLDAFWITKLDEADLDGKTVDDLLTI